jgi:hypothetical protein
MVETLAPGPRLEIQIMSIRGFPEVITEADEFPECPFRVV